MHDDGERFGPILATLRRAVALLREARIPFIVGGSLAAWARGGPEVTNDLDLMVRPSDAERVLELLTEAGMRAERPPEEWLLKAWDGDVLVDIIFETVEGEVTDETIARGEELTVTSMAMNVMGLEDMFVLRLKTLNEHHLEYAGLLKMARALREQVEGGDGLGLRAHRRDPGRRRGVVGNDDRHARDGAVLARAVAGHPDEAARVLTDPAGRWGAADGTARRFAADELAGLACEEGVESRIVREKGGRRPWEVTWGPHPEERFASLPDRGWTLLVQELNRHVPDAALLLEHFSFVPNVRVDDVMVSFAAPGGSVGPHLDSYDVFLVQGQGERRWRFGNERA
ncbi:MAG: nucleotidyltransferase, partial [Actinobacteria bacterium]|nr:nucleotidyltransferase [Actinomycetota bacterium]